MARKSQLPVLSERQRDVLTQIVRRHDSPQQLARRAKVVLLAAEKQNDEQIAPQVALCVKTVRCWRTRWNHQAEKTAAVEIDGNEKALREWIAGTVLADDPYNGKRGKYTPEQITQLYAIACENPQDCGRPISHWSCRELAEEMVKRKIVESIPISTVWNFLKYRRFEAAQSGGLAQPEGRKSGGISKAK